MQRLQIFARQLFCCSAAKKQKYVIALQDVLDAHERIKSDVHRTPVTTSSTMDSLAGSRQLFFKCENFQKIGAFKFRGALNAVRKLQHLDSTKTVVVTHSSGNHAQALALAAKICGLKSVIVMPSNSPTVKKEAVRGYGAQIVECEPTQKAREETASRVLRENEARGSVLIHPFENADVIAGQGTIAIELLDQVSRLDAIIVPVGGGGMISGVALAAKALNPHIKIYGAEPLLANDCARSKAAGKRIPLSLPKGAPQTVADGLRTSIGVNNWPMIRDFVDQVFTVPEKEIVSAMKLVFERMKLVIEPSAAVSVAVALSEQFKKDVPPEEVRRCAVILCGGNVDLFALPFVHSNS
eukprot:TRINITY_DN1284_c0_g1_i1.p1 TRINITY_DN1284_c0_g1~~TRINITY_DN1284_c0_g1_i1.p1  ORF type:complete len:354 (+),score=51.37 TRINITY_DN1284_c0_g1_i1:101-1162(+)